MLNRDNPKVLHEFQGCYVIYKPAYWKCELQDPSDQQPSFVSWIRSHKEIHIDESLYDVNVNKAESGTGFGPLCHRLDRETSGPMLIAKNKNAWSAMRRQFHLQLVVKRYVCLVFGHVKPAAGTMDSSIRTIRTGETTYSEVSMAGEAALTRYKVIAHYRGIKDEKPYSLVACDISTGRTHQIRVHLANLGFPLVCDDKYPRDEQMRPQVGLCSRLFLHSFFLEFEDTSHTKRTVVCPAPSDLQKVLTKAKIKMVTAFHSEFFEILGLKGPVAGLPTAGDAAVMAVLASVLEELAPQCITQLNMDWRIHDVCQACNIPCLSYEWAQNYGELLQLVPEGDDWQVDLQYHCLKRQKDMAVEHEDFEEAAVLKQREKEKRRKLAEFRKGVLAQHQKQAEVDHTQMFDDAEQFPSISAPKTKSLRPINSRPDEPEPKENIDLSSVLTQVLLKKPNNIAHINEINNDIEIRDSLRSKGIQAVTKSWIESSDGLFVVFRDQENAMYVGLANQVKTVKADSKLENKLPYQRIWQRGGQEDPDSLYIYNYGGERPPKSTSKWDAIFLRVIHETPGTGVNIDVLLEKVPEFGQVLGGKAGPEEKRSLLVDFLESKKDIFKVRKVERGDHVEWSVAAK